MKIDKAASLLGLENTNDLRPFDDIDPFNDVRVRGYISRKADHRYGAMVTTHVGDWIAEQVIYCTPKLRYPFDKTGRFMWPPVKRIEVYDKLDGTNICGFQYKGGGKTFVSFKTRLMPFVGNTRNGEFLMMWKQMLEKYPGIPGVVASFNGKLSLSYEMYGALNKHLILYEVPLDAAWLFAVDQDKAQILPPKAVGSFLNHPPDVFEIHISDPHDLDSYYNKVRGEREALIEHTERGMIGSEGTVWYVQSPNDTWSMFKCKPESVEAIHWAAGGIPISIIEATAYNVLETDDTCTFDAVKLLLMEDFEENDVEKVRVRVEKVVDAVNEEMDLRRKIRVHYKELGVKLSEDKRTVMRHLSQFFPRHRMGWVYYLLEKEEISADVL